MSEYDTSKEGKPREVDFKVFGREEMENQCKKEKGKAVKQPGDVIWKMFECTVLGEAALRIRGRGKLKDESILTKQKLPDGRTRYRYDIGKLLHREKTAAVTIKKTSPSPFYLTMPGAITRFDAGTKKSENVLYMDLEHVPENKKIIVESVLDNQSKYAKRAQRSTARKRSTPKRLQKSDGSAAVTNSKAPRALQTHRDDRYGFSFQYPSDWTVKREGQNYIHFQSMENDALLRVIFGPPDLVYIDAGGYQRQCGSDTLMIASQKAEKVKYCGWSDDAAPEGPTEDPYRRLSIITLGRGNLGIIFAIDFSMKDSSAYVHERALNTIVETFRFAGEENAVAPPTSRLLFRNERYGYELYYPADCPPGSNDYGVLNAAQAMNVSFCSISIEPQDPEQYGNKYPEMTLPLKEFAKSIWQMNKFDKNPYTQGERVRPLIETTVDGRTAYQFSVDTSYSDYRGRSLLKGNSLVKLFSNGNMNFIAISHDGVDSGIMRQMIDSLQIAP